MQLFVFNVLFEVSQREAWKTANNSARVKVRCAEHCFFGEKTIVFHPIFASQTPGHLMSLFNTRFSAAKQESCVVGGMRIIWILFVFELPDHSHEWKIIS